MPEVANMPGPKYFFVNKDASSKSLTHSSGEVRTAMQKHVQHGPLRSRGSKPHIEKKIEKPTLVDDKALYNPSLRELTCRLDAFSTASVEIDRTVHVLLDYYIHYYHPTIWNYDPLSPAPQPYAFEDSVTRVLGTALQDTLLMNCLLSAAAARVSNVDRLPFPGSAHKQHYFMQQALALLQAQIEGDRAQASEPTDKLINCMVFLCMAEAYGDDIAAARTHLQATTKLLEPRGGVMVVRDRNLQGQLLMSDLALSCLRGEPCFWGCDFYDPGPVSKLSLTQEEMQLRGDEEYVLGTTLLSKGTDVLPPTLRRLVCAIIESYNVTRGLVIATMSPERAFETTHWITKRNMAIRNRLLAFSTSDRRLNALRTVLIMWTLLAMNITGRVKTVKLMATNLMKILDGISLCDWCNNEDLRLWILLVGYSSAQEHSETYAWFGEQVRRTILKEKVHLLRRRNGLLQALLDFQRGFLFHDPVQRPRTKKLAEWLTWWEAMISI